VSKFLVHHNTKRTNFSAKSLPECAAPEQAAETRCSWRSVAKAAGFALYARTHPHLQANVDRNLPTLLGCLGRLFGEGSRPVLPADDPRLNSPGSRLPSQGQHTGIEARR
jgi:hypothetical protein